MNSVYFVRAVNGVGPVKIGYTNLIYERLASLSAWSPVPLEVLATIVGGADLERRFHAMFLADRDHGEWFGWSPSMQLVIDQITAGTFEIASLPEPKVLPRMEHCPRTNPRPAGWRHDAKLLPDMKAFCVAHGFTPAALGFAATKDPQMMRAMENGRRPGPTVVARVRRFMAEYRPTESAAA